MKIEWNFIKRTILVSSGALLSAIALKIFAESSGLLSGGFSGLSLLLSRLLGDNDINLSFGVIYLSLNVIPTILVFKYVGKKFTLFSLLHVILMSILTDVLPSITITDDLLLIAIFGGILSAFGSLLTLKGDACGGGVDFIAIFYSNKYNKPMWNYVLIFNGFLLLIAGTLYDMESAMYSIIFQFSNTQIINSFHTRYKLVTLHIITSLPDEVAASILEETRHGITKLEGIGMYTGSNRAILYTVLNAFEVEAVMRIVKKTDPNVFINQTKSMGIVGNFQQRPYD